MTARKKTTRDIARETAAMEAPVNLSGRGEDPAVQALLDSSFPHLPNSEALDIALALQQILRGQNSILGQQETMGQEIVRLRKQMAEYDEAARKWNEERDKFQDEMDARFERLRIDDEEARTRLVAKQTQSAADAAARARAVVIERKKNLEKRLLEEPKETVVVPGKVKMIRNGSEIKPVVMPVVVRIGQLEWRLQPGVPTQVPRSVAQRIKTLEREEEEQEARKRLLDASGAIKNIDEVRRGWAEINRQYGSPTDGV